MFDNNIHCRDWRWFELGLSLFRQIKWQSKLKGPFPLDLINQSSMDFYIWFGSVIAFC